MSCGSGELTLSLLDFFDSFLDLVPAFLCLFDRHASLFQAISNHQEINLYIRVLLEAEWLHLIVQLVEHEEDVLLLEIDLVFIKLPLMKGLSVESGVHGLILHCLAINVGTML